MSGFLTWIKEWLWPASQSVTDTDTSQHISSRVDFSIIRYAMLWEDSRILRKALATKPGDRLLSIAAAGDNGLALLLDDPAEVVMVDLSFPQIALCHLKIQLIKQYRQEEALFFLGYTHELQEDAFSDAGAKRQSMFSNICTNLEENVRLYWEKNIDTLKAGVCFAGKMEKYQGFHGRCITPLVHYRDTIRRLLQCKTPEEQQQLITTEWDKWLWRFAIRRYYGKFMLGRMGRDPSFFDDVDINISEHVLSSFFRNLTTVPVRDNFWMEYILTCQITGRNGLPDYLQKENYDVIKSRLNRIVLIEANLLEYLEDQSQENQRFDGFNLSDIFEWMHEGLYHTFLDSLVAAGNPGARLVYWNFLKVRKRPDDMMSRLEPLTGLEDELHAMDRVLFYRALRIEKVTSK